jgi:hypothetical protein
VTSVASFMAQPPVAMPKSYSPVATNSTFKSAEEAEQHAQ